MASKGKRPLLSAQSKIDAIRRVHDGESKASVARDIGVPESTLRGWCKNEEKILILSRQSTPETSDAEPDNKKIKYSTSSTVPHEPSPLTGLNLTMSNPMENLVQTSMGYDPKNFNIISSKTPIITPKRDIKRSNMSERERTRAELNRLSAELGLDRPEFGLLNLTKRDQGVNMSMLATSPLTTNLNHLSGGTSHASLGAASFQDIATKVWNQVNQNAALATSSQHLSSKSYKRKSPSKEPQYNSTTLNSTLNQLTSQQKKDLMTTANALTNPLTNLSEDTMWYWMRRQQELLQLAQTQQLPTSTSSVDLSSFKDDQLSNSWLWKWYKQCYGLASSAQQTTLTNEKTTNPLFNGQNNNILLQQLTKEAIKLDQPISTNPKEKEETDATNLTVQSTNNNHTNLNNNASEIPTDIPKENQTDKSGCLNLSHSQNNNNTKARAVLDDILTNNCNLLSVKNEKDDNDSDSPPPSLLEAIECGQKLLRWMESCSDPAVTVTHIIQFKYLLNNIKQSAERNKNTDVTSEKVNRRK